MDEDQRGGPEACIRDLLARTKGPVRVQVSSEVGVEFPVEVFDELGPGYVGPGTLGLWSACAQGTHYVSVLDLGARSPFLAPVNRYLSTRAFPERMARAWVVHNVEEVGVLEHLLRDILRQRPDVVGLAR